MLKTNTQIAHKRSNFTINHKKKKEKGIGNNSNYSFNSVLEISGVLQGLRLPCVQTYDSGYCCHRFSIFHIFDDLSLECFINVADIFFLFVYVADILVNVLSTNLISIMFSGPKKNKYNVQKKNLISTIT